MAAKIISLKKKTEPTGCIVERISVAECREILNREGIVYTDEEIIVVRDFIHQLAEINYLYYLGWKQHQNETKVIDINTTNEHETQSHTLHPGEYRRTG